MVVLLKREDGETSVIGEFSHVVLRYICKWTSMVKKESQCVMDFIHPLSTMFFYSSRTICNTNRTIS